MYLSFKIYVLINFSLIKIFCKIIQCDTVTENNIIIMALADVCGLKTNQLKNSFLSDFGGSSTHLLDDALTSTTNFTVPYGIDVRKRRHALIFVQTHKVFRISSLIVSKVGKYLDSLPYNIIYFSRLRV